MYISGILYHPFKIKGNIINCKGPKSILHSLCGNQKNSFQITKLQRYGYYNNIFQKILGTVSSVG